MTINAPTFDSFNFVFDNAEVTFDGLPAVGIGGTGRPPVIPTWVAPYGVSR